MSDLFRQFLAPHTFAERKLGAEIHATAGQLEDAQHHAQVQAQLVLGLTERTAGLERQVLRLGAVVSVMGQMLVERGLLDSHRAVELVTAALAELEPPPPEPKLREEASAGSPYRSGSSVQEAAAQRTVHCDLCSAQIAPSRSNITDRGTVCDTCFQAMQIEKLEADALT